MRVAIQGSKASFHDIVARDYFEGEDIEIVECYSFRDVCKAVMQGEVEAGMMAIENTLVGSILPNYSLLETYPLYIVGERYLRIEQHLMALPGQTLEALHCVRSHPMALLQCSEFLEKYPDMRALEAFDTAGSAAELQKKSLKGVAAIAAKAAAELYQLEILAEGVENIKQNYTRFFVLSRDNSRNEHMVLNKASINFRLAHRIGALAEVLNIFRVNGINLTKVQSIPIPGVLHEYAFLMELEWDRQEHLRDTIRQVKQNCNGLKILGIYKKGAKPYDYPAVESA